VPKTVAGVDVGTTKICTVIGEPGNGGRLRILGVGVTPSQGLRKGLVVDIDEAVQCIAGSIEKCQRVSGIAVEEANVSIANQDITSDNSKGVVVVASHEIAQQDIDRAMDQARTVAIPSNRDVIHIIPRGFVVDGLHGVSNPVGMTGSRLEVETHIVCAGSGTIQNLVKCVERAGVGGVNLVLEPLASALAVLSESERETGVVLIDLGGGTTDVAVFLGGSVWHTAVLPVGGSHITNDLAIGLRAPYETAEELKVRFGRATTEGVLTDEPIHLSSENGASNYRRAELCTIIEARVEEIFLMVKDVLRASDALGKLPAGAVITGGTAQLEGIADLAAAILDMPVRVGVPLELEGLVDTITGPAYANAVGLVRWGLTYSSASTSFETHAPRSHDNLGRAMHWLRSFLP